MTVLYRDGPVDLPVAHVSMVELTGGGAHLTLRNEQGARQLDGTVAAVLVPAAADVLVPAPLVTHVVVSCRFGCERATTRGPVLVMAHDACDADRCDDPQRACECGSTYEYECNCGCGWGCAAVPPWDPDEAGEYDAEDWRQFVHLLVDVAMGAVPAA